MSRYNILIVDDNTLTRNFIKDLLKPLEASIEEASDGQEGYDVAIKSEFDLIISDIKMPILNGVDFCRKIKSNQDTRGIPIIMVSAFDSDEDVELGFEAGAKAYIPIKEVQDKLYNTTLELLTKSKFHQDRMILVVDDSRSILTLVEEGLSMAGFKTVLANDGLEALELLKTYRPNLIVTDIYMPNIDGFELCKALQHDQENSTIPIIVMSTSFERSDMTRILQYGAAAYIVKPFHIDELVILVEKLLSDQYIILLKERENLEIERRLLLGSITSLVSALEARDSYTRGHSEDVAAILSGLAKIAGESKEDVEIMRIGGKLHDIGKIGVRDSVLLKPGKLTDEEFDLIKQHPVIGAEILKSIPSFSKIMPIVYSHHERIDGRGYPEGLKGNKIHKWARMTAVADTYHALSSDRPYRKGMSQEKALEIIHDVRGTQLCPESVELFMKWLDTQ